MLVQFIDVDDETIIYEREINDLSLLFELVKHKAVINIFFDPNGKECFFGRLIDIEYTIKMNKEKMKESIQVVLDSKT